MSFLSEWKLPLCRAVLVADVAPCPLLLSDSWTHLNSCCPGFSSCSSPILTTSPVSQTSPPWACIQPAPLAPHLDSPGLAVWSDSCHHL